MIIVSGRNASLIRILLFSVLAMVIGCLMFVLWHSPDGTADDRIPRDEMVRFIHFSDVHYDANGTDKSWRLLKDSPVLLETALREIGKTPAIDFLLFTGDSVNTPKPENFQGFFETVNQWTKRPYYMVLGNHDVGVKPGRTKQDTIDDFRRLCAAKCFPSANTGWYSVTPRPWLRLLVLDGTTDEKITANGFIPEAQLAWVRHELADARKKHQMVIMAAHFPVVEPFHSKSHHIVKPDADKLLALMEENPHVVAYFAGHYHSARIRQRNNIYYVTSPALVEYPNAYRLVTITRDGKLSLDWHPTPLKDLTAKSQERSPFHQTALGNSLTDHKLSDGTLRYAPQKAVSSVQD